MSDRAVCDLGAVLLIIAMLGYAVALMVNEFYVACGLMLLLLAWVMAHYDCKWCKDADKAP